MRIVIDLDGTICEIKKENETYNDVLPLPGAAEAIAKLRANGHYVIIATARNMHTFDSNVGKVIRNIGWITLDWLLRYGIEYDEIYFGKPNADIYIDDRSLRFESWQAIDERRLKGMARDR